MNTDDLTNPSRETPTVKTRHENVLKNAVTTPHKNSPLSILISSTKG